jgi:hypothetical protein
LEESQFRKVYPRKEKNLAGNMAGDEDDGMEMIEGDDFAVGIPERASGKRDEIAATFDKDGKFPVDW